MDQTQFVKIHMKYDAQGLTPLRFEFKPDTNLIFCQHQDLNPDP
jgi:hypothetical protein